MCICVLVWAYVYHSVGVEERRRLQEPGILLGGGRSLFPVHCYIAGHKLPFHHKNTSIKGKHHHAQLYTDSWDLNSGSHGKYFTH